MTSVSATKASLSGFFSVGETRALLRNAFGGRPSVLSSASFSSYSRQPTARILSAPVKYREVFGRNLAACTIGDRRMAVTKPFTYPRRGYSSLQNGGTRTSDRSKLAYIALGSNIGDRLENIEQACRILAKHPNIQLRRTSSLYETVPMYVEDQEHFLNGVCEVLVTIAICQL